MFPKTRAQLKQLTECNAGSEDDEIDSDDDYSSNSEGGGYSNQRRPQREACNRPPITVAKRNARERNRVKLVNEAFLKLKANLPAFKHRSKRVSKLKVLKTAINYIHQLKDVLESADNGTRMRSFGTRQYHSSLSDACFATWLAESSRRNDQHGESNGLEESVGVHDFYYSTSTVDYSSMPREEHISYGTGLICSDQCPCNLASIRAYRCQLAQASYNA